MKRLLEELLAADVEARQLLEQARGEAEKVRQDATARSDEYRRERRAQAEERERDLAKSAACMVQEQEAHFAKTADAEIAALRRRFSQQRSALAEKMARSVLPKA